MSATLDYVIPSELIRRSTREDRYEKRMVNLIQQWDGVEKPDVGLLTVPFSRASQRGDNGSAGAPNAIRMVFPMNTSYSPDFDVDLKPLVIRDLGEERFQLGLLGCGCVTMGLQLCVLSSGGLLEISDRLLPLLAQ